jgi:hypothetical protein
MFIGYAKSNRGGYQKQTEVFTKKDVDKFMSNCTSCQLQYSLSEAYHK